MSNVTWPNLSGMATRGMIEMLYDAGAGLAPVTNGKIDLHIDTIGVGASGVIANIRYNCYLRVIKKPYLHLFFQVTTPPAKPFPATLATPEGETYRDLNSEDELVDAINKVLQRPRTTDVLHFLVNMVPNSAAGASTNP
jgi:hypothetical protein